MTLPQSPSSLVRRAEASVSLTTCCQPLTTEDPHFAAPITNGRRAADFALREDSPAWKLGFERIPVERIGLQRGEIQREKGANP